MPKSFEKAGGETVKMLASALKQWHTDIHEAGVKVGAIMVSPAVNEDGEPTGPALTKCGSPVAACIRLTTPKQRVHIDYDALIEIDAERFAGLSAESQMALLDHELEHLELRRDDEGNIITGDDLRPKLRLKPDDWMVTGFYSVVKRHGEAALEYGSLRGVLWAEDGQGLFDFAEAETV